VVRLLGSTNDFIAKVPGGVRVIEGLGHFHFLLAVAGEENEEKKHMAKYDVKIGESEYIRT